MSSRTIFWNQFSLCSNADGTVKYHGQFTFCNVIILYKQLLRARTYCHFRSHTSTSVRFLLLDSTSQCLIHLTLSSIFAKEETKWEIGDGVDHYKFVSFAQCPDAVALTNVNNNGTLVLELDLSSSLVWAVEGMRQPFSVVVFILHTLSTTVLTVRMQE